MHSCAMGPPGYQRSFFTDTDLPLHNISGMWWSDGEGSILQSHVAVVHADYIIDSTVCLYASSVSPALQSVTPDAGRRVDG